MSSRLSHPLQNAELKFPKTRNNYKSVGSIVDVDECSIPIIVPGMITRSTTGASTTTTTTTTTTTINDETTITGRSARVDSLTPSLPPPMQGWLTKEGHSIMAGWKKRYFVLKEGGFGYYQNESLSKQYGNIALSNAGLEITEVKGVKRLVIMTSSGTPYKLEGADVGVLRDWMEALERHIAYATTMTLITTGSSATTKRPSFTEKSKSFFGRMSRTTSSDMRDSYDA